MRNQLPSSTAFGLLFFILALQPAAPRADTLSAAPPDQLGEVNFPTSCTAEVQPTIEKGVALLHSFQYTESEKTFAAATTREPKCAIAHWGKAMALFHQLWDFPDEKTLKEGRKDIEKAQKIHLANPREQGLINSAAAFYQKNSKMTHAERTQAYSSALGKFHAQSPGDVEFSSFYALSLVSLADEDVDTTANLQKAISILDPLLQQHPDHPGVAHYLIHAADRPEFAAQGLEAARRYAAIAPDSAHALHMPSHIFVRLGLWQDSITSNTAATASAAHAAELHMAEFHYQTHAIDFLSYSYLQSGQEAKARELIEHSNHVVGASDEDKADHRAYLAARTALELHRWKEAAALPIPAIRKKWNDTTYWARAIGEARSSEVAGAESDVKELTQLVVDREERSKKRGYTVSTEKATDLREAEAWLAFAKGKSDEALQELRAGAERQDQDGGESVGIPAREMLADMLLELKRPAEAIAEYKTVLKNSPNRFDGLLGAARAAQASGDTSEAQSFYAKLTQVCGPGADRPELAEAKTYLARK
ncbi:MAG: repeat protein [Candidatus Acidoferrum typicum]|nr:repeat protein [Candidatus Acidoferrum typicum]